MPKSKLKPVNTRNPDELRKSLQEANNLSRLSGAQPDSPEHIERIVHLHCSEGLSLERSILQATEERDGEGIISNFSDNSKSP